MSAKVVGVDVDASLERLRQLASDLRWFWNHAADELWQQLDADLCIKIPLEAAYVLWQR